MSEIDALRAELADQRTRLQALEDFRDLTQIVAQYGPAVDSGSAEAAAQLWTEDGTFAVVGGEQTFTMEGHDGIRAMVNGPHQNLIHNGAAHVLTVPHVEVDGDEAFGRSYALNIRWDKAADRFWVARVSANRWRWQRTDKGWKVVERVNSNLDGAAASRAVLAPRGAERQSG